MTDGVAKAQKFLELHDAAGILILLNAWDAASARVFAAAGAKAIGTTSMGISASQGLPDVEHIPLERMLESVSRIANAVDVPVNADMESGYGNTIEAVVASITRAAACGIAGINIEDGTPSETSPLVDAGQFADRITAIRVGMTTMGVPLVINARTDVYLRAVGDPEERLRKTITRANTYVEAGADCVFVPGGLSRETIAELVREIDAPLNVVANPAISSPVVPSVSELADIGVARVSVGSGLMRTALAVTKRAAEEVLSGSYQTMIDELGAPGAAESYETAIGRTKADASSD
jgi:2-methylisocitrate lyase-like PEP mutase family enzyme